MKSMKTLDKPKYCNDEWFIGPKNETGLLIVLIFPLKDKEEKVFEGDLPVWITTGFSSFRNGSGSIANM